MESKELRHIPGVGYRMERITQVMYNDFTS